MINLEKISGLPVELVDELHLKFSPPMQDSKPVVRVFSEMVPVLFNEMALPIPPHQEMYYMYRDVHLPEDEPVLKKIHIRYDITVIAPGMIGKEFIKTIGHYHPLIPGSQFAYPEMYQVIHGSGLFVIQKMDADFKQLISFYVIEASRGDIVIYPPGYGHIIVNTGSESLVTGNWVSPDFSSLYSPIADLHGMAYYVIAESEKPYGFLKNSHYKNHPPIRVVTMDDKIEAGFGLIRGKSMYQAGVRNPQLLEFLNKPEKYAVQLSTITS